MHTAALSFDCRSASVAAAARGALALEADEGPEGATLRIETDGATLRLSVSAPDLSGLRAALNSWMRLADVAIQAAATGAR